MIGEDGQFRGSRLGIFLAGLAYRTPDLSYQSGPNSPDLPWSLEFTHVSVPSNDVYKDTELAFNADGMCGFLTRSQPLCYQYRVTLYFILTSRLTPEICI
jgi:hypothetical protein